MTSHPTILFRLLPISIISFWCFFIFVLLGHPPACIAKTIATQKPYVINNIRYYPIPNAVGFSQEGIASWYGAPFHGRKTSNGETYDMHDMTVAHKTLPMNTMLLVTNKETGKQIVVRVNDRGPFVKGRIVDLSYTAACSLGMSKSGIAKVSVQAISKKKITADKDGRINYPDINNGDFYVQVGAFANQTNAQRLAKRFSNIGHKTAIQTYEGPEGTLYRVHIYAGNSLQHALVFETKIVAKGYVGAFTVAH